MGSERKSFEEDKKNQDKKILDLEMELNRYKNNGSGVNNNQQNNNNKNNNKNSEQSKLNDGSISVYKMSRNSDAFFPQSFFSFLFSNGHVLHAPVLNV